MAIRALGEAALQDAMGTVHRIHGPIKFRVAIVTVTGVAINPAESTEGTNAKSNSKNA